MRQDFIGGRVRYTNQFNQLAGTQTELETTMPVAHIWHSLMFDSVKQTETAQILLSQS